MEKRQNTDNFKASLMISPVYFIGFLYIINYLYEVDLPDAIFYSVISVFIYIFSSRFYNPDLDHRDRRPGMAHFPLGSYLCKNLMSLYGKSNGALKVLLFIPVQSQRIITLVWFYLWQPLTFLITHRGITHWPIIGVIFRNSYLLLLVFLLDLGLNNEITQNILDQFKQIYLFFLEPAVTGKFSLMFMIYIFPVYTSDIIHSSVDAYDSLINRTSFCPQGIPRGFFATVFKKIILGK